MADFDFSTLVTDRSASDLELLRDLLTVPMSDWTAEQLAEFNQAASKGAYNYTDLNRVTACMDYLNERLTAAGYVTGYHPIIVHPATPPEPVGPLPEGYTQLEYIESSGTQYIDTNIIPTSEMDLVLNGGITSYSNNFALFGARQTASGTDSMANLFLGMSNGALRSDYYGSSVSEVGELSGAFTVTRSRNVTTAEGVTITNSAKSTSVSSGYALYLFASNTGGTASLFGKFKISSCTIGIGGTTLRNFIPCINPENNAGLYDLIGGNFYANAGTGTFAAGPEVADPVAPDEPEEELDPYTWYIQDIPTESLMAAYLANVTALRGALTVWADTPNVPADMAGLTYQEANDIETILGIIETLINNMAAAWFFSGDVYSGEVDA